MFGAIRCLGRLLGLYIVLGLLRWHAADLRARAVLLASQGICYAPIKQDTEDELAEVEADTRLVRQQIACARTALRWAVRGTHA